MKCAQEPSSNEEQKEIAEECKMNCETIQREEQTPKTYRPQRQIKLPESLSFWVTDEIQILEEKRTFKFESQGH